jgi:uncharacterized protein YbaR (Trm112 family)
MAGNKIGNHQFVCCPYCKNELVVELSDTTILKIEDFQKRVKESVASEKARTR